MTKNLVLRNEIFLSILNAPFGFRIEDDTLAPIPEEVEVVRRIFRYYLQGTGFGKIAQELNGQDVPSKPWGEVDQYYVSNSHEAILDKDTFLESQPKAILSFAENIFNGVVERVTVEEDKLCFELNPAYS